MRVFEASQLIGSEPENYIASLNKDFIDKVSFGERLQLIEKSVYDNLYKKLENYAIMVNALKQINKEELNSQRPGGYYSKSARLSYEALKIVGECET